MFQRRDPGQLQSDPGVIAIWENLEAQLLVIKRGHVC